MLVSKKIDIHFFSYINQFFNLNYQNKFNVYTIKLQYLIFIIFYLFNILLLPYYDICMYFNV